MAREREGTKRGMDDGTVFLRVDLGAVPDIGKVHGIDV